MPKKPGKLLNHITACYDLTEMQVKANVITSAQCSIVLRDSNLPFKTAGMIITSLTSKSMNTTRKLKTVI